MRVVVVEEAVQHAGVLLDIMINAERCERRVEPLRRPGQVAIRAAEAPHDGA
jgi:hypothetical protein